MPSPRTTALSLSPDRLAGMARGIEKESLRVDAHGHLAMTPHPVSLGSALTHPHITTDFSESQLEFITGVHGGIEACLDELTRIHRLVYPELGDELLWADSMPGKLPADEAIPLGRYGTSNVGRAKNVYRMGLGHRYGRRMQTISGIHYNWSLPGLATEDYFALIRNFRRHSFLLLYLFGASPAVNAGFVDGRAHGLQPMGEQTLHLPHATSLRMGRLGYQSDAQAGISASFNCLDSYGASMHQALLQPYAPYEAIGLRTPGGDYKQLSTTLLQIENEFYGTIRPKRTIRTGERPLHALRERGVEYVEVRCMDLDPFEPVGIAEGTGRLIDILLLHCLLSESPADSPREVAALARNQHRVAAHGRQPGLQLERGGSEVALVDWGAHLLEAYRPIAALLDDTHGGRSHADALEQATDRLHRPDSTPSARALHAMANEFDGSFLDFALAQSEKTRQQMLASPLGADEIARFRAMAETSREAQRAIEAADTEPFEAFRQAYLSVERLVV